MLLIGLVIGFATGTVVGVYLVMRKLVAALSDKPNVGRTAEWMRDMIRPPEETARPDRPATVVEF